MERQTYINQVAERLQSLLAAEDRLPCTFVITGGWTTQTDGPITVYLDQDRPFDGIFEGMDVFGEIQRRLNEEFAGDPWYFGIGIGVPHHFLGQKHMDEIRKQAEDNVRYRRVRLKDQTDLHTPPPYGAAP